MAKVSSLKVQLQNGTTNTLYATWGLASNYQKNVDKFSFVWQYCTGQKSGKNWIWFDGGTGDTKRYNTTYSIPSNASSVRVCIKPIAKTKKSGKKTVYLFTGEGTWAQWNANAGKPETPSAPTVTIDRYVLTATSDIDTADKITDQVEFYVTRFDGKAYKGYKSGKVSISKSRATFTCKIDAGYSYRVTCRYINNKNGLGSIALQTSDWAPYSADIDAIPAAVTNVKLKVTDKSTVSLTWTASKTAKNYTVEYTTNRTYFNTGANTSTQTSEVPRSVITGLESGKKWWFRVRGSNDQGDSSWAGDFSTIIGTEPGAPTTWSSTTTGIVGEMVYLYWVHNTEDGSNEVSAEVQLVINGKTSTVTVNNTKSADDSNQTSQYALNLSGYSAGATVLWRVRTKGITGKFGDWSIQRTVEVFAPPSIGMDFPSGSTLTTLPFTINLSASPSTQKAITFDVSVISQTNYRTNDYNGDEVNVRAGDSIFSKVYNANGNSLSVKLDASNISLESGQTYTIRAVVAMSSGLTSTTQRNMYTSLKEREYYPDATVTVDNDVLCAYVSPRCEDGNGALVSGVELAVYRREYDGSLTEIQSGLSNNGYTTVTDPHPSLDYARYRIVVREKSTSNVTYEDIPGIPFDMSCIVLQWDESWETFDYDLSEGNPVNLAWGGSMVKLPFNVDTSESHDQDVELVEYQGRKHPVAYHGTQTGEGGAWSSVIEADDIDTLFALRRLAAWMGVVYVRNPSGVGYWAQVSVSISQTHNSPVIPVSLTIKRVEGGA